MTDIAAPNLRARSAVGRWVILATVLGSGMALLDSTAVNVTLPAIGRHLHAPLAGLQWTVTASHELLEMLGDPDINLTAFVQPNPDAATGLLYAYEVCDACENDQFGYDIDGSLVSDFVYPAWFESFRQPGSTQFDYQKKISKPFELLPGGYIGVFDVTAGNGWQQIIAPEKPGTRGRPVGSEVRPHIGSRRERRRILRSHWIRSRPIEAIHENTRRFREYPRGSRG